MGISLEEILLIALVALIVIRPERWPEVASYLGNTLASLSRLPQRLQQLFSSPPSDPTITDTETHYPNTSNSFEKLNDDL